MNITAIVTSHNNPTGLLRTLHMLQEQSHKPHQIIVLVSDTDFTGTDRDEVLGLCDELIVQKNYNDFGHVKRARGLELATGDYVAFINDDDYYDPAFLRKLLEGAGFDIIACDFKSHNTGPDPIATVPVVGQITSGNFIVRRALAQEVGYNHRVYEADGLFIRDLMVAGAKFIRVPEVLYDHR